jgi:hypothetical protein
MLQPMNSSFPLSANHLLLSLALVAGMSSVALLWPSPADAQTSPAAAPTAAPAASAPSVQTPARQRENAPAPGTVEPDPKTVPQISVPLGRSSSSDDRRAKPLAVGPARAASAGGIDDDAARCRAQASEDLRLLCLAQVKRPLPPRAPG